MIFLYIIKSVKHLLVASAVSRHDNVYMVYTYIIVISIEIQSWIILYFLMFLLWNKDN